MLDVSRIAPDGFAAQPYSSDIYIGVSRLALGKEADAARVEQVLDSGSEEPSIATINHVLSTQGRSESQLISTEC